MDIKELQAQLRRTFDEAKRLGDEWKARNEEMPKEVQDKITGLLGKCDEIEVKIKLAEQMASREASFAEGQGTKAAQLSWRESGPGEGEADVDPHDWREIEVKGFEIDAAYGMLVPTSRKLRFHIPVAVTRKGYKSAFEAYIRGGIADMGPNDRKTLSEGVDSAGGYLVPEDFHMELIRKLATSTSVRANARVVQTSRDIASWPKIHYTDDDKYTSGVRLTWTGESPASSTVHRVTDPVFGLHKINVHTAMASLPLTNDLLEDDAFDVDGVATDLMAEAFTLGENDAFWNGNGIARPRGVLATIGAPDGPAYVASGDASTLLADGLIDLAYSLPAQYDRNSKFYMTKQTEKVIRKLKDANDGNYLWPVVAQSGNLGGNPRDLLTYPVVRDEFLPAIGADAYPIVFGDMNGYLVLDRVGIAVQRLSELYAETNITLLLARKRVGGQLIEPWRLKVQKCATT